MARLSSVEPLSTTMSSKSCSVWAQTDSMESRSQPAPFRLGITTVAFMARRLSLQKFGGAGPARPIIPKKAARSNARTAAGRRYASAFLMEENTVSCSSHITSTTSPDFTVSSLAALAMAYWSAR